MTKVSSKKIASIAARMVAGGDFLVSEARAVAASVVSQAEAGKPIKKEIVKAAKDNVASRGKRFHYGN